MTELLLRLFVRKHGQADSPAARAAAGTFAGTVGIVCNLLLFAGKLLAGVLAGSLAVTADALNNLSDASSSVVTLVGFRMARRPADEEHPFGHARYEYLAGLMVAFFILCIGVTLANSSLRRVFRPEPTQFTTLTLIILLLSAGVKLWMSLFFSSLGRRMDSAPLRATAVDARNDVIATLAVLAGGAAEHFTHRNLDGVLGLAVALFILWSGLRLVRETLSPLLGRRADPDLVDRLRRHILANETILGVHDLLIHDYGPGQCFASVHTELDAAGDPLLCHEIIDDIERSAMRELGIHLVIHHDPVAVNDAEWDELRALTGDILHALDPRLSFHDFRLVRGSQRSRVVFDLALPPDLPQQREDLQASIEAALQERAGNYSVLIHFDEQHTLY